FTSIMATSDASILFRTPPDFNHLAIYFSHQRYMAVIFAINTGECASRVSFTRKDHIGGNR
ncbi:hypothetical protein, partial [Psychrobacter sp. FME13]|uniref:hypothetical protein n=1 Tax=Psychrobacter sp. FME13 TaxID=2487708 RepID=UPI001CE3D755